MGLKTFAAAAAVGFAAAATSSAALAAPVVDEFARICLPASNAAEATDNARAAGYVAAPSEIKARMKGFPGNGEVLWRASEGEMMIFLAITQKRVMDEGSSQALTGEGCMVGSAPPQSDLKAKMEAFLDVGPEQTVGKSPAYVYEATAKGRARLNAADKALMGVKTLTGVVRLVGVLERNGVSGAILMTPTVGDK